MVRTAINRNAINVIRCINIDAIKDHILGQGRGDSNANCSLENYCFAIISHNFDWGTPRSSYRKICTCVRFKFLRIGSSPNKQGIAGFEQADRMLDGSKGC